jgi:phage terminase large subunit-like protein
MADLPFGSSQTTNPVELFAGWYMMDDLKSNVPPFHKDMYALASSGAKRIAISAPRGFAKSIIFSKIYSIYLACTKRASRILLLSATGTLSRQWIAQIKSEFENNRYILDTDPNGVGFGDLRGKIWTQDCLEVTHPDGFTCEILAKGRGYQVRGFRPDVIIVDDLEDDDSIRKEDQRKIIKNWFDRAVINTLPPDAQLVVIGTRLSPLALLSDVLERPGYVSRKFKAIIDDGAGLWEGRPLWPEYWPMTKLRARFDEIGEEAFYAEFMDEPRSSSNPVFFKEWIQHYNHTDAKFLVDKDKGMHTIIGIDPAISKSERADDTALCVISATYESEPIYYIRQVHYLHGATPAQVVDAALNLYRRYEGKEIVCEDNAYQAALIYEFSRFATEHHRHATVLPIRSYQDKVIRARNAQSFFENMRVFFNSEDKGCKRLEEQMLSFPEGERDDGVDACSIAFGRFKMWKLRMKNDQKINIVLPRGYNQNSMLYRRTGTNV